MYSSSVLVENLAGGEAGQLMHFELYASLNLISLAPELKAKVARTEFMYIYTLVQHVCCMHRPRRVSCRSGTVRWAEL